MTSARILAFAALIALVLGPLVAFDKPRLGRAIGLPVFVAFSVATWAALGSQIGVTRLEPVKASLGALGWGLLALGWGDVRTLAAIPEEDPNFIPGPPLEPRSTIAWGSAWVLALAVCGSLGALFCAWLEVRPRHALLAHSAALFWAIALVTSAAEIAILRGHHEPLAASVRLKRGLRPLLGASIELAIGALWRWLH